MLRLQNIKLILSTLIFKMKTKEKHKDLKKKVNIVEKERNLKRGQKSWHDLRTLKKLKLNMKDKLSKSK